MFLLFFTRTLFEHDDASETAIVEVPEIDGGDTAFEVSVQQ